MEDDCCISHSGYFSLGLSFYSNMNLKQPILNGEMAGNIGIKRNVSPGMVHLNLLHMETATGSCPTPAWKAISRPLCIRNSSRWPQVWGTLLGVWSFRRSSRGIPDPDWANNSRKPASCQRLLVQHRTSDRPFWIECTDSRTTCIGELHGNRTDFLVHRVDWG